MEGYTFGYKVGHLTDGRVEVIEPDMPLTIEVVIFLIVSSTFIFAGALYVGDTLAKGFGTAPWEMAVFGLVGLLLFSFGGQVLVHRRWVIDSSIFTRQLGIKRTPFLWQRTYRLQAIEIFHEVWQDEAGASDSVKGVVADRHGKAITFVYLEAPTIGSVAGRTGIWVHTKPALKPSRHPRPPGDEEQVEIKDEVVPQVWWLGHWLAGASHLPLRFHTRVRKAPDRSGA